MNVVMTVLVRLVEAVPRLAVWMVRVHLIHIVPELVVVHVIVVMVIVMIIMMVPVEMMRQRSMVMPVMMVGAMVT